MPSTPQIGRPFDDAENAAWHGLLRTHALVIRTLDEALERAHRLSVSEFDVLITLHNSPDEGLRMSELADAVMLSPSGLTRLVARLEREGLIKRVPSAEDGRSFRAQMTPEGGAALAAARPTHNAVIRDLFLDRVTPTTQTRLAKAWSAVHRDR